MSSNASLRGAVSRGYISLPSLNALAALHARVHVVASLVHIRPAPEMLYACAAARTRVTDELGPVFQWTPDTGKDDDSAWDAWEVEL